MLTFAGMSWCTSRSCGVDHEIRSSLKATWNLLPQPSVTTNVLRYALQTSPAGAQPLFVSPAGRFVTVQMCCAASPAGIV